MRNPFKRAKKCTTGNTIHEKELATTGSASGQAKSASRSNATEGRLVVMGRESTFSNEVIEYAIDMARRMSYEILALNSAPLSCDSFSLFSTSRNNLCQEFQTISEKNAISFRQQAEANGIPFTQVIKFDEPEQALASVQREYGNIEFVISEPQPPMTADLVADSNRPRNEVLVYSMI